jgi:hypothetical protein
VAVVNTKSQTIIDADARPVTAASQFVMGGRMRESVETLEVVAADSDTSTYRALRVHSSWRISQILILNDAITGGTSYDVGLYDIAEKAAGAVIDADAFASAVDLSTASTGAGTDVTFEAVATDIDKIKSKVWQRAGLTTDPNKWMDLVLTANTVGTADGTISVKIRFVAGD